MNKWLNNKTTQISFNRNSFYILEIIDNSVTNLLISNIVIYKTYLYHYICIDKIEIIEIDKIKWKLVEVDICIIWSFIVTVRINKFGSTVVSWHTMYIFLIRFRYICHLFLSRNWKVLQKNRNLFSKNYTGCLIWYCHFDLCDYYYS